MLTTVARTSTSRSLSRSLHTTAARTMPLYVCYCPDYPNNLETRKKAREAHLAAATEDKKTGQSGESPAAARTSGGGSGSVSGPLWRRRSLARHMFQTTLLADGGPLDVRGGHGRTMKGGIQLTAVFGRAFLNEETSTHTEKQPHADQLSGMDGSVMILRQPTIEAAWDRIKSDEYWKQGVWDKEKVLVREIIGAPVDETIKIQ